jgi:hypothetical protein
MKKYFVHIILLLAGVFMLSGCFDIKREIKFFPNGGGTETAYITLDKDFYDKMQVLAGMDQKWKKKLDTLSNNMLLEASFRADVMKTSGTSVKDIVITELPDGGKQIFLQYSFDEPVVLVKIIKEATNRYSNGLNIIYDIIKFIDEEGNLKFKNTVRNASRTFDDSLALRYQA